VNLAIGQPSQVLAERFVASVPGDAASFARMASSPPLQPVRSSGAGSSLRFSATLVMGFAEPAAGNACGLGEVPEYV
jgi:hypothetical protein